MQSCEFALICLERCFLLCFNSLLLLFFSLDLGFGLGLLGACTVQKSLVLLLLSLLLELVFLGLKSCSLLGLLEDVVAVLFIFLDSLVLLLLDLLSFLFGRGCLFLLAFALSVSSLLVESLLGLVMELVEVLALLLKHVHVARHVVFKQL